MTSYVRHRRNPKSQGLDEILLSINWRAARCAPTYRRNKVTPQITRHGHASIESPQVSPANLQPISAPAAATSSRLNLPSISRRGLPACGRLVR